MNPKRRARNPRKPRNIFEKVPVPHNRPWFTEADERAVIRVMRSGYIGSGEQVRTAETELTRLFGTGSTVLVSSGTAALFLVLKSLALPVRSRIAVPSYSCTALLDALRLAELEPVVVDVTPDNFTIDSDFIAALPASTQPIAAVAVHLFGSTANISALSNQVEHVVEDACQSFGPKHFGTKPHCASRAIISSFYATKVITCGYGGMVWSSENKLIARIRRFIDSHWLATQREGFNFRISDLQAAILREQLLRLDDIVTRRREIARRYAEACDSRMANLWDARDASRLWYRFLIRLNTKREQAALIEHLCARGIQADPLLRKSQLLHRVCGLDPARFPISELLTETIVSIPLFPSLTEAEISQVCGALSTVRM